MKTRLHELSLAHWALFVILIPLTSWLIATQSDNTLAIAMMILLLVGFVRVVGRLTDV